MDLIQAIWLAIIEGLTEFLPISSTAHMIFLGKILGVQDNDFTKMFTYSIQLGAILAVVVLYWRKFFDFNNLKFYLKLAVAVVPALILGVLFSDSIDQVLEKPFPIAVAMVVGGVILLFIDTQLKNQVIDDEKKMSFMKSFIIGVWQCLAMMPGVSRSAASIIGGMQQRLTRKAAAEFSFFLAVPTMLAVTVYSLFLKNWHYEGVEQKGFQMLTSSNDNLIAFAVGNVLAFLIAMGAIKFFISFLNKYGFRIWGIYRIIVGLAIIAMISGGFFAG